VSVFLELLHFMLLMQIVVGSLRLMIENFNKVCKLDTTL
jgi:hypothetical protein